MSDSKRVFEQKMDAPSFILPGFPDGHIPDNIVVTEHAKEAFRLARPYEIDYMNIGSLLKRRGQGMVGIAWLGKDEKDHDALYLDLLPAFNKGDKQPRSDKHGDAYKEGEYAYTDEPIGGNSGRNHEQFLTIIQNRIQKAFDTKDEKTLQMYAGCYSINNDKVVIDKSKMFGFGIFKSDVCLLSQFRAVSANINFESVERNPEYLLINYFDPAKDINDPFQREYYLKRPIPQEIASRIKEAFLNPDGLPLEKPEGRRECMDDVSVPDKKEQEIWQQIKSHPEEKINYLLETLCKFADLKTAKLEKMQEVIFWIKHNIALIEPDPVLQQIRLKTILERPSKYNGKNVFETALSHNYQRIVDYMNDQIQIRPDHVFNEISLCKIAREENNPALLKMLLEHNMNALRLRDKLPEREYSVVELAQMLGYSSVIATLLMKELYSTYIPISGRSDALEKIDKLINTKESDPLREIDAFKSFDQTLQQLFRTSIPGLNFSDLLAAAYKGYTNAETSPSALNGLRESMLKRAKALEDDNSPKRLYREYGSFTPWQDLISAAFEKVGAGPVKEKSVSRDFKI